MMDAGEDGSIPSASEVRLVHAARSGDHDAFGTLVLRYERRVMKVIRRFSADRDVAADLAQESFVRAFERLDQFDPSRRFGPWLFRLAVNLTYDHLRKIKRRGRWALFSEAGEDRIPDPEQQDPRTDQDLSQEVRTVLAELPEAYRTVLILRDLEGFCTSEVAAVTERSEATVRWRLAEARKMFKEAWERREHHIEKEMLG
ncbi:MAG: sigma-70 family RNA polymerase sigma factor [Planctomycetaceae bacterium]|nr:sigma-70 family RNA polymerase sigma factor [Planctomycetaceae bacterium]